MSDFFASNCSYTPKDLVRNSLEVADCAFDLGIDVLLEVVFRRKNLNYEISVFKRLEKLDFQVKQMEREISFKAKVN